MRHIAARHGWQPGVFDLHAHDFAAQDGEVVTQSLYKRGRQVVYSGDVDERVGLFVEQRLAEWQPLETFVIDVCDGESGLKIVEINTLNSSAFYAADVVKLVAALEQRYSA